MTDQLAEAPFVAPPGTVSAGAAELTPLARQYLDETRPWVRLMSVVTFLSAGLTALGGVVMFAVGLAGGFRRGGDAGLGAVGGAMLAVLYMALALIYVAPGLFLSRYAGAIKRLQTSCTAAVLEDAIKQQRSFWRFVGILTVIGLVVAVLVIGLAVVAGVIGAARAART